MGKHKHHNQHHEKKKPGDHHGGRHSPKKEEKAGGSTKKENHHLGDPDHAANRAVSLGFLMDFCEENECWHMPTGQVMADFVAPVTDATEERPVPIRYTELLPSNQVGFVSVFVSHTWSNPFGLVVSVARKFASSFKERHAGQELYFWVDIFAINQHQPELRRHDIQQLDEVVNASTNVLVVLDPMCRPLSRVWCLFEIVITLAHGKQYGKLQIRCGSLQQPNDDDNDNENYGTPHEFIPVQDPDTLRQMAEEMDLDQAEATVESDREMIMEEVKRLFPKQGIEDVNRQVRRMLRKGW